MSRERKTYAQLKALTLSGLAYYAINDDRFVKERAKCYRFVRQVVQAKFGSIYDKYHKASAHLSALAWKKSVHVVTGEPQKGDLLFWYGTAEQPHGHAAIKASGSFILENSIVHNSKVTGGKGIRSLSYMRAPDLIVRLPL